MTREYREGGPSYAPYDMPYDNKTQRLKRKLKQQ